MTEEAALNSEIMKKLMEMEKGSDKDRMVAALWIEEKAENIVKDDDRLMINALKALIVRVIHETNEDVRQSAWETGQKIGNEAWNNPEHRQGIKKQIILDQFLKALRECDDSRVKLAAIEWLEDKLEDITRGKDAYRSYKRVADTLDAIKTDAEERIEKVKADGKSDEEIKEQSEWEDIRERSDITLKRLWETISVDEFNRQKDVLRDVAASENERITAIWLMTDRNTLGSREALRFLVDQWVEWIREKEEPRLVEYIAEAIRYNRFTVLALIEHFGQEPQRPQDIIRRRGVKFNDDNLDHLKHHIEDWVNKGRSEDLLLEKSELEKAEAFLTLQRDKAKDFEGIDDLRHLVDESRKAIENEGLFNVNRRIAKQLADMSDPAFFEDVERNKKDEHKYILIELRKHAVPVMLRRLPSEDEDKEIREHIVRMLGYTGGREAVGALARQLVGEEKKRKARQELLDEYYLKPSLKRSEEAAEILNDTIIESKRTLRILQALNIAVFLVGLTLLAVGLYVSMKGEGGASRVVGALSAIGGFTGMIALLIKDPLDRIQNAMANLVHIETAFTGFIWELNLNGAYIQSVYVKNGKLKDEEIAETAQRIENAMEVTMYQVSMHTEEGEPRLVTRINRLEPVAGSYPGAITIYGQHLLGESSQKMEREGIVAFDHVPVQVINLAWKENYVRFELPDFKPLDGAGSDKENIMISLFVDGMETNALPFHVLKKPG